MLSLFLLAENEIDYRFQECALNKVCARVKSIRDDQNIYFPSAVMTC